MRPFCYLRVGFKLLLRRFFIIPSFCKECGKNIHDFYVNDEVWAKVVPSIKRGNTLCYDCFCEKCAEVGLPSIWRIEPLE